MILSYVGGEQHDATLGIQPAGYIPGVGQFYLNSITTRDYSLLMAMTMLYAFAVAFLNVVVDDLYAYVDPRVRYE